MQAAVHSRSAMRVIDVFELLAAGESREQILADHSYLESNDIAT